MKLARPARFLAAAVLLTLAFVSCHHKRTALMGSRSAVLGHAKLVTEYRKLTATGKDIALLHVLLLPAFDMPPGGGFGHVLATGGTVEESSIQYGYYGGRGRPRVDAQRVSIHNDETVEAAGRSFALARGNVFIAEVSASGAVTLSQLPLQLQGKDDSAEAVVAAIKAAVPANARVQALPSASEH